MEKPFISRAVIANFRNFLSVDIQLNSKQVLFGENESGKSNYLVALQLILDPSLSDEDRSLEVSDFNDSISDPVGTRAEIVISLYFSGFEDSKTLLAQLSDAVVNVDGKKYLRVTYRYFPDVKEDGSIEYHYSIFKGNDPEKVFGSKDRRFLQIKVIRPLRDVEYELRNRKTSPLARLVDRYDIQPERIGSIVSAMQVQSEELLKIDEIRDLQSKIQNKLVQIVGSDADAEVGFSMTEIDYNKILSALRLLLSGRYLEEKSLGMKNVLYIALLLLHFHEDALPTLLKERDFVRYADLDSHGVLKNSYNKTENGNYMLKAGPVSIELREFFFKNQKIGAPEVIIAIEEPEAHLHPILQRLVFQDVILNSDSSVILTTHSPNIASIVPLEFMIHVQRVLGKKSTISAYEDLKIGASEKADMERFLDVNRGEVYFGRSVLLVEGIAEEYLLPKFASILGFSFDKSGVVVCRIDSTNFEPYSTYLGKMNIPHVILTDGDYFEVTPDGERIFHIPRLSDNEPGSGYLGAEVATRILSSRTVQLAPGSSNVQLRDIARENDIFFGEHTFEIDIMQSSVSDPTAIDAICNAYDSLCVGGSRQRTNFRTELANNEYFKCLAKIESRGIGKGRFAQTLSGGCLRSNIPDYVTEAINRVISLGRVHE
jgi:putative ATP-dependent endonuclease of OLD family